MTTTTMTGPALTEEKRRKLELDLVDTREALEEARERLAYAVLIGEGRSGVLGARVVDAFAATVSACALLDDLLAGRVVEG